MAALHRTAAAAPALLRQRASWLIFAVIAALIVGIAAFQVSQFSSLTNTSYEINELNRIRAEKQARNHELEADVAWLSSLARVDIEARVELNLQPSTKVMHIGVNLPAPTHQTLPSRFQPVEQTADEQAEGDGWIERMIEMVPFFCKRAGETRAMFGRHRMKMRLAALAAVFAIGGVLLIARTAYLQIAQHDYYQAQAQDEHFGLLEIRAPRGAILDRNGYPLATTVDAYDIFIDRAAWQDRDTAYRAAEVLGPILGRPADDIVRDVRAEESGIFLLHHGLAFERGAALHDTDAPGLRVVLTTKRAYPEGDMASALLGFVGRDHEGLTGVEGDFDRELGGVPGTMYFERDSIGNRLQLGSERIGQKPKPGGDIRLTIDRYIQRLIEGELETQIAKTGALGGSIIVMDPKTGAILGMTSKPGFQLSQLDLNQDVDQALFRNRAVTDVYEPGSVFKTLTASMALDLGKVTPNSPYFDSGAEFIGESTIRNWDLSANGTVTVTQILQRSLNTGATWMSEQIGEDAFYTYLRNFGIGQATGVGLSGEPDGLVRDSNDPAWAPVDLATNSFGQGVAATPLQVITAVATFANGGKLMRPYIVESMDTPEGPRTFDPVVVRQVVSEQTAAQVADMMNQVVEGVPGNLAAVKGYHVAGKTGTTTEATLADGAVKNGFVASFVGFAPTNAPRMVVLVKLDFREDRLGGQVAAPVFSHLTPKVLAYLGVQPEGPTLVTSQ